MEAIGCRNLKETINTRSGVLTYTAVDQCHSLSCIKFCRNTMDLRNENDAYEYYEKGIKNVNKMYNP